MRKVKFSKSSYDGMALCPFVLAKKLQELGLVNYNMDAYTSRGRVIPLRNLALHTGNIVCPAPTLEYATRWLRETFGVETSVLFSYRDQSYKFVGYNKHVDYGDPAAGDGPEAEVDHSDFDTAMYLCLFDVVDMLIKKKGML